MIRAWLRSNHRSHTHEPRTATGTRNIQKPLILTYTHFSNYNSANNPIIGHVSHYGRLLRRLQPDRLLAAGSLGGGQRPQQLGCAYFLRHVVDRHYGTGVCRDDRDTRCAIRRSGSSKMLPRRYRRLEQEYQAPLELVRVSPRLSHTRRCLPPV